MRGPVFLVSLLVVAVLAGCLGDQEVPLLDEPDEGAARAAHAADVEAFASERLLQAHDHVADHAAHAGIMGFERLGETWASEQLLSDGASFGELVVKGDHAYLATTRSSGITDPGTYGGFVLLDIEDPTAPKQVGRWLGQPLGDLEVTDDGAYAFAPTQRNGYPYPMGVWEVAPQGMAPRGISVVDVTDKTTPRTMSVTPLPPNGPHTVNYYKMPDGRELLFAATYDILFTAYPESIGQATATQKVVIYEFIRDTPPRLEPLSIFQIVKPDEGDDQYFPHDATAHVDPATGRVIMDVAYWDLGLVTVDITDPASPVELARFADTSPSEYVHTHLVRVFPGTIEGRVVGVLEPEIPTGSDTGTFTFVDLTDPADPQRLGAWMLPGDLVVDVPFQFSPHNFDLVCGGNGQVTGQPVDHAAPCEDPTVVLSHNHGGLWALDASDPTAPAARAFYFPAKNETGPTPSGFGTVFVQDGLIYAPETRTGLHVLSLADIPLDG